MSADEKEKVMPPEELLPWLDKLGSALRGMQYAVNLAIERERAKPPVVVIDSMRKLPEAEKPKGLTAPQIKELRLQRDKGPQPTFGKHRVRTQNLLVWRGLSAYFDERGERTTSHGLLGAGYPTECRISKAGLAALKEREAKAKVRG
jgi:hypothetical protein